MAESWGLLGNPELPVYGFSETQRSPGRIPYRNGAMQDSANELPRMNLLKAPCSEVDSQPRRRIDAYSKDPVKKMAVGEHDMSNSKVAWVNVIKPL